jgi:hypothetical protein
LAGGVGARRRGHGRGWWRGVARSMSAALMRRQTVPCGGHTAPAAAAAAVHAAHGRKQHSIWRMSAALTCRQTVP